MELLLMNCLSVIGFADPCHVSVRGRTTLKWQLFASPPPSVNAAAPVWELYCQTTYIDVSSPECTAKS
jgi:hypothetical protein